MNAAGAWCTATASVYDAAKDENNVYVNSNQPYATATASADGYARSYKTNASGYALIYLNGPPPGTRITVTVGKPPVPPATEWSSAVVRATASHRLARLSWQVPAGLSKQRAPELISLGNTLAAYRVGSSSSQS